MAGYKSFFLKGCFRANFILSYQIATVFSHEKKEKRNLKLKDFESQISAIFNDSFNNQ